MSFDNVNHILYSANWNAGVWALKVIDPVTTIESDAGHSKAGFAEEFSHEYRKKS